MDIYGDLLYNYELSCYILVVAYASNLVGTQPINLATNAQGKNGI